MAAHADVIQIGADPEMFVMSGSVIVPVCGMLNAGKWDPLEVDGGMVLEDNVLAEFGITPATSADQFAHNIKHVVDQLNELLAAKGATTVIQASHVFDKSQLVIHPQALEFGCEPDFNAWLDGDRNPRPRADNSNLRSAGGHVHIGFATKSTTMDDRIQVMQACDVLLGLPSVVADEDTQRRQLYGKAGAFRPKSYGAEYRTLSNFWLREDALMKKVFERAKAAVTFLDDVGMRTKVDTYGHLIQEAINTSHVEMALELMKIFEVEPF